MSYSQKQGSSGNSGGAPSNQASQQAAKALAGIQQQMQNLVHGQNTLPQSSQAGLNAFLTQQHYEMLKQQQQQLLLSNPQLQQRFQQQMQQSKDRGEPLALTRTPAAADLLNKTYQQHHQQQSNGNNATAPSLASVNQFQQQMQAANLMQQLHAYQLQFQQQQQQQQQQHHQQPQQSHHQQQSAHQMQQKSHAQSALASASALQGSKQQHNQQIQQSQYSQKYMPTAAHSKSSLSGVGIPPPPAVLANQLKPPNLPPSTQITPIPSPQHTASNNNLSTKGSSSSSAKQVPPSISLLPAKQPPVSLSNAPVAAHLHHHLQNKVPPISIPNQYNNPPGSKGPLVSAIPPPFPSHYQKMSSQPQPQPLQQHSTGNPFATAAIHEQQEPKLQANAVSLTKQQHPPQQQQHYQPPPPTTSSSIVSISSGLPAKVPIASQTNQKPIAPLIPLLTPTKETTEDIVKATPSPPIAAQVPLPAVATLPSHVPETKINTPDPAPPTKKPTESGGSSSVETSPARPTNEPESPSPPHPEAKNGESIVDAASENADEEALAATTKIPTPETPVESMPALIVPNQANVDNTEDIKNIKDTHSKSTEKMDNQPLLGDDEKKSCTPLTETPHDTSDDKTKPSAEEESPTSDLSSTEVNKSNDTLNNTSSSSDDQQSNDLLKPEKPVDEPQSEKQEEAAEIPQKDREDDFLNTSEENISDKPDKSENPETVEQPQNFVATVEKDDMQKQVENPENEKSKKPADKVYQSEKPLTKSKTPRQSKAAAAAAILAEASGQTAEKKKDSSAVKSKTKIEKEVSHTPDVSSAKIDKADKKKPQNKTKKSSVLPTTPSTPSDRKSQRHRLKTILYQSPLPELAFITKLSASEASNSPKPHMSNEDKLIVFYKNEYMAVRNAEGSFFLCQTLQNVYRSSPRITIRWLSEDKKDNTVFIPDFYDHTDIECVLTTVDLKKVEKGHLRLPEAEKVRIENILKKAIDVEKGIVPRPDVTEENPDGLDISLYKDESQIEKKTSLSAIGGSSSKKRGRSARIRSQSKIKSATKKRKSVLIKKKKRKNYEGSDSNTTGDESEEEDDDGDDSDIDMEYKPTSSRKKSILSNVTQITKSLRAQRSPLARARAASPLTPTSSRSKTSVPQKTETHTTASSVNSRNDRALKRRTAESTNTTPEIPTKRTAAVTPNKAAKGVEKNSNNASSTSKIDESVGEESQTVVNKASLATAASTKKIRTGAAATPPASTPSTSGTRPTRSRK